MSSYVARREAAETIAREAGRRARSFFERRDTLTVDDKGHQDFVTEADREVEAFIRAELHARFPDDAFLGEESGGRISGPTWVVDPIDGTNNFVHGMPLFAVSLGWLDQGVPTVGAICDPMRDELYSGTPDGAWLNGQPIRVSSTPKLSQAVLCAGHAPTAQHDTFFRQLRPLVTAGVEFRRLGSAAIGLAYVAAGRLDAFWQMRLSAWDVAGAMAIIRGAGGRSHPFFENLGDDPKSPGPILSSNPQIYDALTQHIEL